MTLSVLMEAEHGHTRCWHWALGQSWGMDGQWRQMLRGGLSSTGSRLGVQVCWGKRGNICKGWQLESR
jgi:hypothetical protein